ncbi:hypothetical protein NQ318_000485 [Aromia moschata]|uniref:Transposase n=1 Tax=Aromia moschata TaxID=1265417 RepID=A0AAV8X7P8_9CUCU|nr:hypothetical protein NQ318_000485 [Aromia moschata]
MLMLEENPHTCTSNRQTASALNISHSSILRVLTENQMHPYKLVPRRSRRPTPTATPGKEALGDGILCAPAK